MNVKIDKKKLVGAASGATSAIVPFVLDEDFNNKVKMLLVGGGIAQVSPILADVFFKESTEEKKIGGLNLETVASVAGIIASAAGAYLHAKQSEEWTTGSITIMVGAAANATMLVMDALKKDEEEVEVVKKGA